MKQSDEVQELNHQKKNCVFYKHHRQELGQNQMDINYSTNFY